MKKRHHPLAFFLLLIPVLCASPSGCGGDHAASRPGLASSPVAGGGTLLGNVTRGPLSPIESADAPRTTAPAAGVTLLVMNLQGEKIAAVTTDKAGAYSLRLAAGSYQIELKSTTDGFSKDVPATVTVYADRKTRYDIRIDTGIR